MLHETDLRTVDLINFKMFFRDDDAYSKCVTSLKDLLEHNRGTVHLLTSGQEVLGAMQSAHLTKEMLCDRLRLAFSADPSIFEDLKKRLDEEVVSWDEAEDD